MAFISNLLAINQPSGVWVSIIKAFESGLGNYILAIILLTVVIRVVWAVVDTVQKYSTQRMSAIQSQMQPEMEKLEAKYAKQPQILQQKKNELQQRYMGKSQTGSCIVMLVVMVLNLVIFFTLFGGLNSMASYKTSYNYDNLKYTYANCLNVADKYLGDSVDANEIEVFKDYENLKFVIEGEGENKTISLVQMVGETPNVLVAPIPYVYDFSYQTEVPDQAEGEATVDAEGESGEGEQPEMITIASNQVIFDLIQKYFDVDEEGNVTAKKVNPVVSDITTDEEGQPVDNSIYLADAIQNVAMKNIVSIYDDTKEGFLWIENIWAADSAFENSIMSYSSVESKLGKKNVGEHEEQIYNAFMTDLKAERNKTNGYFILPILCVLAAMLSSVITTLYNNHKNKKKGLPPMKKNAKWAQIVMPLVLGIFALFYNSVFAIYMLTGQVVSAIILPLQLFIVDKIMEKKEKKKEEENVVIDYSRKF